ncbi:hypothetical protein BN1708_014621 [Verticillium longisporum]|uniref:Uncharacterized protein n=1 Tax=Verticillium longisporum TaxID=100787 RepID=A0A0G4LYP2_VERLO|nr:hypothetical protein BN1708_014621 [Verticillium longisporum]
MSQLSKERSSS